jgi:hypothetical protein
MRIWSKGRRQRLLALARYFDSLAAGIRKRVKAHTPHRKILRAVSQQKDAA